MEIDLLEKWTALKSWWGRILEDKMRFLLPVIILLVFKLLGAIWLFGRVPYQEIYRENPFLLFYAWDSEWYYEAARYWYSMKLNWNWFPGYPIIIRLVGSVIGEYDVAAVVVSFILGLAWLPLFQTIAEKYMPRKEALTCTLLTAFFPTVFIFTTVAYSESLYLFACLASGYLYKKKKYFQSLLLASVVAMTRVYGILFVIPYFIDRLIDRDWENIGYTTLPFYSLLFWQFYSYLRTGSFLTLAPFSFVVGIVKRFLGTGDLLVLIGGRSKATITGILMSSITGGETIQWELSLTFALLFVGLIGYLTIKSWDLDWRLGLFSTLNFIFLISFAGHGALSRYLVFSFPLWLNFRLKKPAGAIFLIIIFYLSSLYLWEQLLTGYLIA